MEIPECQPDGITDSVVELTFISGYFRPDEHAINQGCPNKNLFRAAMGRTKIGNSWAYLYLGNRQVWRCNEKFFQAHFVGTQGKAVREYTSREKVVTEADLDKVWGNANFGSSSRMDVIKYGLLKVASGYYQGHTSATILRELGLITESYNLTTKGRYNLYKFFADERRAP